ncbi:MAG: OmpA family protein [Candidatus Aminicenantes bacterium]|nr:OmpA family protein [Candidatus Aminicenantes bacterium]
MKKSFLFYASVLVIALAIVGTSCATKKYVSTEVAAIDQKVAAVSSEIEEAQKRIREHDEKLATIGELIGQHDTQFKQVDGKIEEVKTLIRGNLVMTATLSNDEAKFAFNSAELSAEAKAAIDRFVQKLIEENKGVYLEIQGHTDNTGPEEVNIYLGQKRAEAVMMYLYKTHRIPLHRMSAVSLGSSKPVAENTTREGRAKNRRVEILVYE